MSAVVFFHGGVVHFAVCVAAAAEGVHLYPIVPVGLKPHNGGASGGNPLAFDALVSVVPPVEGALHQYIRVTFRHYPFLRQK